MKQKTLFLINTIGSHGPGRVVFNILQYIDTNKFEVTLATIMKGNDSLMVKALMEKGIRVIEYNCKNKAAFIAISHSIIKHLDKQEYDIVNSHGIMPDYVCSRMKKSTKKIATLHNNIYEDYKMSFKPIVAAIAIRKNLKYYNNMDLNICCSKSIYMALKKRIKSIDYITNGVDVPQCKTPNCDIRKKLGIKKNNTVFLFAGKIEKRKRVPELIRMFKMYHNENEYLLIAGEGNEYDICNEEIGNDNHIIMVGYQKDIYSYMNISDVYISNSSSEGMSISCLEALGSGNLLFLSNITSHYALMQAAPSCYIGELFNRYNFESKLKTIRFQLRKTSKNSLRHIHKTFFSAKTMSIKYQNVFLSLEEGAYE